MEKYEAGCHVLHVFALTINGFDQLFLYKSPLIEQVSIILPAKRSTNEPIPSHTIKKALAEMEYILGPAGTEALIYDLENYGIVLLGRTSYSLNQLESAFRKAVGEEAAALLIERLGKNMDG